MSTKKTQQERQLTRKEISTPRVDPCRPVFKSQEEMDCFFREFREVVAFDLAERSRDRTEPEGGLFLGMLQ